MKFISDVLIIAGFICLIGLITCLDEPIPSPQFYIFGCGAIGCGSIGLLFEYLWRKRAQK